MVCAGLCRQLLESCARLWVFSAGAAHFLGSVVTKSSLLVISGQAHAATTDSWHKKVYTLDPSKNAYKSLTHSLVHPPAINFLHTFAVAGVVVGATLAQVDLVASISNVRLLQTTVSAKVPSPRAARWRDGAM